MQILPQDKVMLKDRLLKTQLSNESRTGANASRRKPETVPWPVLMITQKQAAILSDKVAQGTDVHLSVNWAQVAHHTPTRKLERWVKLKPTENRRSRRSPITLR
ncbi:hypothetical protein KM043_018000 [Ampulex compressa]|nr:hypothetical protein KM043_018000 [Ampulex compressa]